VVIGSQRCLLRDDCLCVVFLQRRVVAWAKPLLLSALVCLSTMVGVSRGILIPCIGGIGESTFSGFRGRLFRYSLVAAEIAVCCGADTGAGRVVTGASVCFVWIAGMSERFSRVRIPVSMRLNMGSWFLALLTLMFLTSKPYFRHIELVCGALGLTVYGGIALLLWSDFHRFSSAAEEERSRAAKALVD